MAREPIRALVIDDEPPARQRIVDLLARVEDVEVAGECGDGRTAVSRIEELRPDLLFLDVQMPQLDGFGVLEQVAPEARPTTVFVTAYDRYALRAFEEHALDYLLKPFSDERFVETLERARRWVERGRSAERLDGLLRALGHGLGHGDLGHGDAPATTAWSPADRLDHLVAKRRGSVTLVPADEVDWLEGAGTYTRVHAGERRFLYRETIGRLCERLDPRRFVRIHRSTVVRVDRIERLEPRSHGEFDVVLFDGTRRRLSRSYRRHVEDRLGQRL
ncbi:MAG TPA: response regulator transcription factor [Thermoanaerobaculia bacterium]|nr:response regulator transcription factor [Thermoanaerobaculia bacterium]